MSNARTWNFSGTTGKLQAAYLANIQIKILTPDGNSIAHALSEVEVAFCPDFEFPGGGLLGQIGFFSRFRTTFHQPDNYFDIEPL